MSRLGGGVMSKDTLIGVWLFGGLVPALIGVNSFALSKATAESKYEGFVDTDAAKVAGGATRMRLASLLAADVVLEDDVSACVDAYAAAYDDSSFLSLGAAIGAPTDDAPLAGSARYLPRATFKAAVSRKLSRAPDAALDAVFNAWAGGSGVAAQATVDAALERWRRSDGSWDLGAIDRGVFLGDVTVLFGFFGLLVLDAVTLVGLGFAIRSLFV